MPQPKITINRGKGGLGRPLATKDHISGFIMPVANSDLPAGFAATDQATRTKVFFAISEAEDAGITEAGATTKVLWYQLNQYFKKQPLGKVWVYLIDSTAVSYSEVEELQNFADGEIRQMAFYNYGTAFSTVQLNSVQSSCTDLEDNDKPVQVIFAGDFESLANIAALDDLRLLSNKNVAVCIGEDGSAAGAALRLSESKSITCIGALLGTLSLSKVHENIGWVEKFNQVDGSEFDVPALAFSGATVLVKNQPVSAMDTLHDKGYIFLKKQTGSDGSYFNDSSCAMLITSDYAQIENNRTIDKAIRGIRTFMIPNINAPLYVQDNGSLSGDTISKFENDANRPLEQMERDGELSAFKVTINPVQDVLATSKLSISVVLVPVGVARQIEINIGYAVSIN